MVWHPDSVSWSARVNAGPWEGEAISPLYIHVEASPPKGLLVKGLLRRSIFCLPLRNLPFLSSHEFKWRNSAACSHCVVVASLKKEDSPSSSTEFFELARKKVVRPFLSSRRDLHTRLSNASSDRAAFARNHPTEERDLSPGLFHPGQALSQFQASTERKGPLDTRVFLHNFKKICIGAWESGLRTVEATSFAPLIPFTSPLLAVVGFALIFGIILGRWIGRASTQGVQLSNAGDSQVVTSSKPKAPTGISVFSEGDMKKKESVEWVNMVLGKLWKVYRLGLESWLVGLLQPLIDNLQKPDYVSRVQIKRFELGDEPISVRSVERRTSRRANDLQYHIGLRYTGGARMLLLLKLRAGFIPITIPVGVRGLDVDGELWVKLRLVPAEPWVGTATWAFVSLPKIKLDLSPFRLFNLMAIPFLSIFLTKLLTQDLPQLFVRPNKNVIDFLQGRAVGPVPKDFKGATLERNKDFSGELSVTLVDARKLKYAPFGKTDPYVILILGDQVIRSKKNSQTSVIGPPGGPIWNQDFQLLVVDPKTQRLHVRVRDFFGLTAFTVGLGEVDLISLKDTVPADKVVRLRGGWGPFLKRYAGEVLLRLTYTAYVEDEEEDIKKDKPLPSPSDPASVADGTTDASPLVKEVIDKVVEAVRAENPMVNQAVNSLLNMEVNDAPSAIKGLEEDDSSITMMGDGLGLRDGGSEGTPAEKDKMLVSAQAEDRDRRSGSVVLLCLGVVTLLSILVAISFNFSNLMNP
eukprot:c14018_g1_i1 orf=116-2362(+)